MRDVEIKIMRTNRDEASNEFERVFERIFVWMIDEREEILDLEATILSAKVHIRVWMKGTKYYMWFGTSTNDRGNELTYHQGKYFNDHGQWVDNVKDKMREDVRDALQLVLINYARDFVHAVAAL